MTDIETRLGKFTNKTRAEEAKAASWIGRHPGWTLAIIVVETLLMAFLLVKAYA